MSKDTGLEKFEPGDELMKELDAMNGIVDGRGDHWKEKRLAAGEKPPLKKVPKKNDKLLHDAKSLLDVGPVKGGRGKLTLKEMTKDLPAKLVALGLDPIDYIAQMLKDPDAFGLEGKDVLGGLFKLADKLHATRKAVEIKEEKHWKLEVVKRDFEVDDDGEVVDV